MKSATTGAVSGCVVWMIVFCVLSACLLSVAIPVGSFAIELSPDFITDTLGPYLCPQDSTAEIVTRQVTGVQTPATSYNMRCVDANGNVVQEPSPNFAFIWLGILAIIGLILSALIAFLFAAPVGVLMVKLVNRLRKANSPNG